MSDFKFGVGVGEEFSMLISGYFVLKSGNTAAVTVDDEIEIRPKCRNNFNKSNKHFQIL